MNIFKQMYTVRRYKGTRWDSGTAETTYSDMQLPLDVQPKRAAIRMMLPAVLRPAF